MQPFLVTELAFLIDACCGRSVEPEAADEQPINWTHLYELAVRHSVECILWHRLRHEAALQVPPDIGVQFQEDLEEYGFSYLQQVDETRTICGLLKEEGIEALVLKGGALARELYPQSPALRGSSDLDLLIDRDHYEMANRLLVEAGYKRDVPGAELPSSALSMALLMHNAFRYSLPSSELLVELHQAPFANPAVMGIPFKQLLSRSRAEVVGCGEIRGLGDLDQYVYLCCHAVKHHFSKLKWFVDLALLTKKLNAEDFDEIIAFASKVGAKKHVALAWSFMKAVSPQQFHAVPNLAPSTIPGSYRWMLNVCFEAFVDEHPEDEPQHLSWAELKNRLRDLRFQFHLGSSLSARLHSFVPYLIHPDDTRILKLGSNWVWLYAIVGRPLAMLRLLNVIR